MPRDTNFLEYTLGDWLDHVAETHGDCDAIVYRDRNLRMTYRQFNDHVRRVAKGLMALGIQKGDHVAVWATNYPEWLYLFFATAKIGAVLVTVNTNYRIFELEYLMRQSDSMTLLFIDGIKTTNYVEIVRELVPEVKGRGGSIGICCERLPRLRNILYAKHDPDSPVPEDFTDWDEMLKMGGRVSDAELNAVQRTVDMHDITNMQYTSGTTGFPKGVMLTHYNVLNNGFFIGENMRMSERDRYLICVPFFHCFGMVLSILNCVTHATCMVVVDVYSPTAVMEAIQEERCTAVNGVPTMFIFMLEHPDYKKYNLSSLRTGIMAGSNCPVKLMRQCAEEMYMTGIVSVYGLTESSPGITTSDLDDTLEQRTTTVGRSLPHCEAKVVNPETMEELPPNQPGEIVTRGYHIMRGYYNMPEATKAAITEDGWLHSGDIGTMDEDGFYRITGRLKDMIIRGGENIYPREIEELYYHNEKIKDVQVVGLPSRKFGEETAAFIILKEGISMTEDEAKDYVRERMSRHKVPSYIVFVDSFPMTASGKIQKYKLREQGVELFGLQGIN